MSRARPTAEPGGVSSSSREAPRSQAQEHWRSCPTPALLVEGEHGLAPERTVQEIARRAGTRLIDVRDLDHLRRLSTVSDPSSVPRSRAPGGAGDVGGSRDAGPATALLLRDITRLPRGGLEMVDAVLRAGILPVAMTSRPGAHSAHRFVHAAGRGRGMRLRLGPQTFEETASTLARLLDDPPTAALTRFLHGHSRGRILELESLVEFGLAEGWLVGSVGRTAIARPPEWSDRRIAARVVDRLAAACDDAGLALLRRLASDGPQELDELLRDREHAEVVFILEADGLVELTGRTVSLAHALHGHVLGRGQAPSCQSADVELTAGLLGEGLITGMHAAPGRQDDAGPPESGPRESGTGESERRRTWLSAAALAAAGHLHAALDRLEATRPQDTPEALEAAGPGAADPAATLRAFIRWGLLQDRLGRPHQPGSGPQEGLAGRLRAFQELGPAECLRRFPSPLSHCDARRSDGGVVTAGVGDGAPELDPTRLELCVGLALEAYAAAQVDERARAREALAALEAVGEAGVPVVCLSWVTDRMGVARTLLDLSLSTVPECFTAAQTPERTLLTAQAVGAVELFAEVARGVPPEALRDRLDDLWSQFEAEGPVGHVTRKHLEALDFLLDGDRSRQLQGPPGVSVARMGEAFADPWVTVVVELARLLHAPGEELSAMLASGSDRTEPLPGVRRLMLRCVALRRGHELPPPALDELLRACRRQGVEPETLELLTVRLSPAEPALDAVEERLRHRHPHLRPWRRGTAGISDRSSWGRARQLLSPREGEIVDLLLRGLRSTDVAARTGISVRTVQTHVRNVYRKLEVTSRTELRARLIDKGAP